MNGGPSPASPRAPKPTTTGTEHQNLVHESQIPSIATKASSQPASLVEATAQSSLSFALPSSLAIFKQLTWELTPWTLPIDPATARTISAYLPSIPPSAIHFALCLGVAHPDTSFAPKHQRPRLYVLFPHLHHDISQDEKFLTTWHNEVVKPAFDEAWVQSGLVDVFEKTQGGTVWVTEKAGPTAEEVFERFFNSDYPWLHTPQNRMWPAWTDKWAFSEPPEETEGMLARGMEGGYSDQRARVFEEAWSSMQAMLKFDGEQGEMSDPVLLAVWEKEAEAEGVGSLVRMVGREWDEYADSRFVEEGKFFVHLDDRMHQEEEDEFEDAEEKSKVFGWLGGWLGVLGY